jgi:hypothetical protein
VPEEGKRSVRSKPEVIESKGCNPPVGFNCETHAPIDYDDNDPSKIGIVSHWYHHPCTQKDKDSGKCKHDAPAGAWQYVPLRGNA